MMKFLYPLTGQLRNKPRTTTIIHHYIISPLHHYTITPLHHYTMNHITTTAEVHRFFDHLIHELRLNFHPDNRFEDYVTATAEARFTPAECKTHNRLMDECFAVCEKEGTDIYEIGYEKLYALIKEERA